MAGNIFIDSAKAFLDFVGVGIDAVVGVFKPMTVSAERGEHSRRG